MAPNSLASWRSTRTSIGSVTSAAPRASSSRSPSSSAEAFTYALLTMHDCPLEVNRKSIERLQRKPSHHLRKPSLAMHLFHLFQGGLHRTKSPVDHLRF